MDLPKAKTAMLEGTERATRPIETIDVGWECKHEILVPPYFTMMEVGDIEAYF